jgi:hypothetical protein
MREVQDDNLVDDLDDDFPQDPDEPIVWVNKEKYKPPVRYTEEAIIDGQKITVYVEEIDRGIRKFISKKRRITLFGREFEVPLHADITPMIVRYTGKSCVSFEHGREYMVITKNRRHPGCYSIVDESGEDYVHSIEGFEIVREGDGPPPEGF